MGDNYEKNSIGSPAPKSGLRETSGRDTGTGEGSIIKRNQYGTRPFTGDVKRKTDRHSYGKE